MFELKSVYRDSRKTVQFFNDDEGRVIVRALDGVQYGGYRVVVGVSKTELREGLAREFGWTIYDNADLPEVTKASGDALLVDGVYYNPASEYSEHRRKKIREYLAVEAYVAAHPPVKDPADELAAIVWEASRSISAAGAKVIADALINSGKVVVK